MSTVKIKTEPATAVAAAVTADVQVKLEPSLSTSDVKLEQHSSDIDTKVEPDSDADSEEDIKSENDEDDEDTNQSQRQFICKHSGCDRSSNHSNHLRIHQLEHRLQTEIYIHGKSYTLVRQSLDDRWPCPILDCEMTYKTVGGTDKHIRKTHINVTKQQHHQQSQNKKARHDLYCLDVHEFYVTGIRCGFHNATGVFICHDCRLVPECLLAHLQQKHGFEGKSIDSSVLPKEAVYASADPNVNQHISNPHLAVGIGQSCQQHPDIARGWLCITSDCGHCGYTKKSRGQHHYKEHKGEQISTAPALVLRLPYGKIQTSYLFITRLDIITDSSSNINRVDQNDSGYEYDDGDELVLSDYSDEDDSHWPGTATV